MATKKTMRPLKCRVWWPKELSLAEPPLSDSFLFGWFVPSSSSSSSTTSSSSDSIDVVVGFACNEDSLSDSQLGLEGILRETNEKMPVSLQDKAIFSLVGHYNADLGTNGRLERVATDEDEGSKSSTSGNANALNNWGVFGENFGRCSYEYHKLDGLLDQNRRISIEKNWIQLVCHLHEKFGRQTFWIPKSHHIRWNDQIVSQCDVHLILYETPTYGAHHFSLHFRNSFEQTKAPLRKPNWFEELKRKQPLCDMDTVILALNSAIAARILFRKHLD